MSDINLFNADCFKILPTLKDESIDCIICDLPYGVTACKWDSVLPLNDLWKEYSRLIRKDGAIVLFATQPFTSVLICSNLEMYRYSWLWNKNQSSNFQLANIQPLRLTEDIIVFSKAKSANGAKPTARYFPVLEKREKPIINGGGLKTVQLLHKSTMKPQHKLFEDKHPTNILNFSRVSGKGKLHPTQKPVELLEYLIQTYTLKGELVLDNCMGSGTTGVACKHLDRDFIGIEKEKSFFEIAQKRIEKE